MELIINYLYGTIYWVIIYGPYHITKFQGHVNADSSEAAGIAALQHIINHPRHHSTKTEDILCPEQN